MSSVASSAKSSVTLSLSPTTRAFERLSVVLVICYYARNFAARWGDPDLGGRLAVGRLFFAKGHMPLVDPFAYTPTLPMWVDHEWLTGVVFYALQAVGGDAAILVTKTLLGLGVVGLIWATARLNGAATLPLVAALAIAMPVLGYGMLPRAQVFTYFLFAVWLYVLERFRHGGSARSLALLPVSMLAWANLHGGFLAGLGLLALYVLSSLGDRRKCLTLLGVLSVSTAITLINPYGLNYWWYLVGAVTMHRPGVNEWASPPFTLAYAQYWLMVAVTFFVLGRAAIRRDLSLAAALTLAITLVLSVRSARHMPLFAICACSFLPRLWPRTRSTRPAGVARHGRSQVMDLAIVGCLAAAITFQVYGLAVLDGPAEFRYPDQATGVENLVTYPVEAVHFAGQHQLCGNLAVPFNWGEYAIWQLYPECRVSMDGRYETAYPQSTVELVENFFLAKPDWQRLLDDYATNLVLAPPGAPVNAELGKLQDWKILFSDHAAILWARVNSAPPRQDAAESHHGEVASQ